MSYTVEQVFAAMGAAIPSANFPAKVILMNVEGKCYWVDGANKTVEPCQADKTGSDLQVTMSLDVLMKLVEKKLTPQQAFMKRMLKIKGNMGLAMKLTVLVNATRKQLQSKL